MPYSYLSHLECSRTQDRYDADEVQGTSKVGAPLLARYDLEQVRAQVTPEEVRARLHERLAEADGKDTADRADKTD